MIFLTENFELIFFSSNFPLKISKDVIALFKDTPWSF